MGLWRMAAPPWMMSSDNRYDRYKTAPETNWDGGAECRAIVRLLLLSSNFIDIRFLIPLSHSQDPTVL